MRNLIAIIVLAVALASTALSQQKNFTISKNYAKKYGMIDEQVEMKFYHRLKEDGAQTLVWRNLMSDIPTDWNVVICTCDNCFPGAPVVMTSKVSFASDSCELKIDITPSTLGTATLQYEVSLESQPDLKDTITFVVVAENQGVDYSSAIYKSLTYTSESINLNEIDNSELNYEIYNSLGSVVLSGFAGNSKFIDISNLAHGKYFVVLTNDKERNIISSIVK